MPAVVARPAPAQQVLGSPLKRHKDSQFHTTYKSLTPYPSDSIHCTASIPANAALYCQEALIVQTDMTAVHSYRSRPTSRAAEQSQQWVLGTRKLQQKVCNGLLTSQLLIVLQVCRLFPIDHPSYNTTKSIDSLESRPVLQPDAPPQHCCAPGIPSVTHNIKHFDNMLQQHCSVGDQRGAVRQILQDTKTTNQWARSEVGHYALRMEPTTITEDTVYIALHLQHGAPGCHVTQVCRSN